MYSPWERPVPYEEGGWIYADASAHRLVSDISALVSTQAGHRIIVAGDWNILHGYGEGGSPYWGRRYQTVFDRMDAIGFDFIGPTRAEAWPDDQRPDEMPVGCTDEPTYRTRRDDPNTANRQLDFVFASRSISEAIKVQVSQDGWVPSDHCRIEIEVSR